MFSFGRSNLRNATVCLMISSLALCAGCQPATPSASPETWDSYDDFELGEAEVTVPTGGEEVLRIAEEGGSGSVVFFGEEEEDGTTFLTGLEAETDDGLLSITLDEQERPITTEVGDLRLSISYRTEGTIDLQLERDGELLVDAVSVTPVELVDPADEEKALSSADLDRCVYSLLHIIAANLVGAENDTRLELYNCFKQTPVFDEVARAACVLKYLIQRLRLPESLCVDQEDRILCLERADAARAVLLSQEALMIVALKVMGEPIRDDFAAHGQCTAPEEEPSEGGADEPDGAPEDGGDGEPDDALDCVGETGMVIEIVEEEDVDCYVAGHPDEAPFAGIIGVGGQMILQGTGVTNSREGHLSDCYRFQTDTEGTITITGEGAINWLLLYDAEQELLIDTEPGEEDQTLRFELEACVSYYVRVDPLAGEGYTLTIAPAQ
jgi:hypothetical protein